MSSDPQKCPPTAFNLNTPCQGQSRHPFIKATMTQLCPRAESTSLLSTLLFASTPLGTLSLLGKRAVGQEIPQHPPAPIRLQGTPCPQNHCAPEVFEELLLDTEHTFTWIWLPQVLPWLLTHHLQQNNRPGHSSTKHKPMLNGGGAG